MSSRFTLVAILMIALVGGVFIGCEENTTGNNDFTPDPNVVTNIEIRVSHSLINGLLDDERTEQITAIAKNAQGVGVPGVELNFGIENPEPHKGTITVAAMDSVTDSNGQITATYSVVLEQDADVTVFAQTGQIRGQKTIQIRVRTGEGNLSVEVNKSVLTVPPGQSRNTTVTATLVDDDGLAIPGVQVDFRTNPAIMGFVDSDTGMTDNSGRAIRTFSSIVNQYGTCEIIAAVNDEVMASANIEIRPVAGPSAITVHASPDEMKVPDGGNATSQIMAVVTDSTGVGVPQTTVLFELQSDGGAPIFGSLTSIDTLTNNDGEIYTNFNTRGGYGQQWVVAKVVPTGFEAASIPDRDFAKNLKLRVGDDVVAGFDDELQARILITVEPIEDAPRSMSLSATPSFFNLHVDSTGHAVIHATVRDENRNGIANLAVNFRTTHGTIANPTATDSTGVSRANFFIRPIDDLDDNEREEETTTVTVSAEIPGTNWEKDVEIEIKPQSIDEGTLTITTSRKSIFADGTGLTFSVVTAILKDGDGQVLAGEPIVFTSSFPSSVVQSPITTDTLGRAVTVFDDNGEPYINAEGEIDSVTVTARYDRMNISATTKILIDESNPVETINVRVQANQLVAGSSDSTAVRAVCRLGDNSPAPAGTEVNFDCIYGTFTTGTVEISGNDGAANTFYVAGNMVTTDTITAFVQLPNGDEVYSNEEYLDLVSGPPSNIVVSANPTTLFTNDPQAASTITATVMDTSGNPVRPGTFVSFETTLGTIHPSSITDENGEATSLLNPGVSSGVAQITASVNHAGNVISSEATVTFVSGAANVIELTADPLQIQVAGTGGISTSTLTATVRDPNGNLVEAATPVYFELINEPEPPAGCTFDRGEQLKRSMTSNGQAVASLNSGTQIGGKLVRAFAYPDSANEPDYIVEVTLSTVAVVAGPPFQLDIDVNDDGEDAGGGAWMVEVSARVWDIHRNPVANNIPVVFTVEPEIANIDPGHTGNEGFNSASEKGLAFSRMVYNSVNTFDAIEIGAEVATRQGQIIGSREHILPMQDGVLELNLDPANWMFEEDNEQADIRCWAILRDGHQIRINGGSILFTSNRARFWWKQYPNDRWNEFFPEPSLAITGLVDREHNEPPGTATVYLRAEEDDIFLDPFTLEVSVQINASVQGYDDVQADPAFIFFTRRG